MLGLNSLIVDYFFGGVRFKTWIVSTVQVLQGGGLESPTKPKGRPKKNSIPSSDQLSEQERTRDVDRQSDGSTSSHSDTNQEE